MLNELSDGEKQQTLRFPIHRLFEVIPVYDGMPPRSAIDGWYHLAVNVRRAYLR